MSEVERPKIKQAELASVVADRLSKVEGLNVDRYKSNKSEYTIFVVAPKTPLKSTDEMIAYAKNEVRPTIKVPGVSLEREWFVGGYSETATNLWELCPPGFVFSTGTDFCLVIVYPSVELAKKWKDDGKYGVIPYQEVKRIMPEFQFKEDKGIPFPGTIEGVITQIRRFDSTRE